MDCAKLQAEIGLEDEASTKYFDRAVERFEKHLPSFGDDLTVDSFVVMGSDKEVRNIRDMSELMSACEAMLHATSCSVDKWSPAMLQEYADHVNTSMASLRFSLAACCIALYLFGGADMGKTIRTFVVRYTESSSNAGQAQAPDTPVSQGGGSVGAPANQLAKSESVDAHGALGNVADYDGDGTKPFTSEFSRYVQQTAIATRNCMKEFSDKLATILSMLNKVEKQLLHRLGEKWQKGYANADYENLFAMHDDNVADATMILQYIEHAIELSLLSTSGDFQNPVLNGGITKTYTKLLFDFHSSHWRYTILPVFQVGDSFALVQEAANDSLSVFFAFVNTFGNQVHQKHVDESISSKVGSILEAAVDITMVHASVVHSTDGAKPVMSYLLKNPGSKSLHKASQHLLSSIMSKDEFADVMDTMQHNIALKDLSTLFAKAAPSLKIPGAVNTMGHGDEMNWHSALLFLEVLCLVRDNASVATLLEEQLLGGGQCKKDKFAIEAAPRLLKLLMGLLVKIDAKVNHKGAIALDKAGWQTSPSMATVRDWVALLSSVSGRLQNTVMSLWATGLSELSATCEHACPDLDGFFTADAFNEALGLEIQHGIDVPLNELVTRLDQLDELTDMLEISPQVYALQGHELLRAIYIARSTMKKANTVCVTLDALWLLSTYRNDPNGPSLAQMFLDKYRLLHWQGIPNALWSELEHLASNTRCSKSQGRMLHFPDQVMLRMPGTRLVKSRRSGK